MTNPPDWVTAAGDSTPAVHPSGTEQTAFTLPPLPGFNLVNFVLQLIENLLGNVVKAIVGVFIPGPLGSAFTQLQTWATNLLAIFPAILKLFSDILTFNWAAVPGDLITLAGLGINATPLSSALSQTVTSTPPVAFDSSSHGEVHTGNPTSKIVPHTTANAANAAMTALVAIGPLTPKAYTPGFVSATYNGVALQSQGGIDCGHGTDGWLELFTLNGSAGPAAGTHDVVVTTTDPVHSIIVDVETYTGCSGFSGFTSAATNAQGQGVAVKGGSGGMVVVGMASANTIASLSGATQRSLQNVDTTTAAGNLIVGDAAGADSVTITATR